MYDTQDDRTEWQWAAEQFAKGECPEYAPENWTAEEVEALNAAATPF